MTFYANDPLNWDNAPSWANYLAMDDNGHWHWYECKPWFGDHHEEWYASRGRTTLAYKSTRVHPSETLQQRQTKEQQ